jgi:hypothetical protein
MMVNKLYVFSKNTDAFFSQRGYNYQTLKTLETWLQNFVSDIEDDIYCEFEEDIFQKDLINKKLKFRQIKLYSTNFSFSSDEIRKCISHFFILHIKSDYNDFQKDFVFETNTAVAKKYLENDADLLREWSENQDNIEEENLVRYSKKVKEIITEYIEQQTANIKDKNTVDEAIEVFQNLEDSFWKDFTKMIQWKFIGISPEEEFSYVKSNIENLILQLPYENSKDNLTQIFGVLLESVFTKVTEKDEQKRKLTLDDLEQIVLNIGTKEDKWYSNRYEYYKNIEPIDEFRIGEFYEILDLVNYCRRKKYLHKHIYLWNPFLIYYSQNKNIDDLFRRKAIYEIVFLNNRFYEVDYENLDSRITPKGSLFGFEDDIRFYFKDFQAFKNSDDLENANNLLNILFAAIGYEKINISYDELKVWFIENYKKIIQKLIDADDINEKCKLLEQKGNFLLGINRLRNKSKIAFIKYYEKILDLVENAPLFKLSQFGDRIEKYIKMHINIDPNDEMGIIGALEKFSDKLFPLVGKREGKTQLARSQVQRGYSYLNTTEPFNLLKALDYFHKAKDNYLQEDTIEGYILALLNISQLYNAIGMHFAAKNYALAGFRMSINRELVKRTETSLVMLFYADFKQGSWFNAINIYSKYIGIRLESNFDKADFEEEGKATQRLALILYVMNKSSNQFKYFINDYIKYLDYIGEDIIKPLHKRIDGELDSEDIYHMAIEQNIDDYPLNDIGKKRIINFYALGSLWNIRFDNSYDVLSIAEEYISTIQILLAEIALSNIDFHVIKSKIEIELELREEYLPPEQIPSNNVIKWKIYIYYFNDKSADEINKHSAFNVVSLKYILNEISLLELDEFERMFWSFFPKMKIDSKQIAVNLYQNIHRDIYLREDFEFFNSSNFENETFDLDLPKENKVMKWKNSLSEKYDREFCIEAIKDRFSNTKKCIYITLNELKLNPDFPKLINDYREKGWKDWQIISNIQNFMINHKIQIFEKNIFSISDEHEVSEELIRAHFKYKNMDEKDCYIKFPLEAFNSDIFRDQFNIGLPSTLKTYGLETKLITPNFKAIKEFLDIRFNMSEDNYNENNPLKYIL